MSSNSKLKQTMLKGMLFNETRQYNIPIFYKTIFLKYRTRQIKATERTYTQWAVMETLNSEHILILTNYKYSISHSIDNKHNLKWNFNKANWEGFLKDCDQVINIYNNINTFNTELTKQIIKIASNTYHKQNQSQFPVT